MTRQLLMVGSAKTKNIKRRRPRIRLSGLWLNSIGFESGKIVAIEYVEDKIYFKAIGEGIKDYNKVVKDIVKSNKSLIQVRTECKNKKYVPSLELKGYWLEEHGFEIGSVIVVEAGLGYINIQLISSDCVTGKKLHICIKKYQSNRVNK